MDNQQVPKADSKFQKKARKNHRKWKLRLLSKGGQKADSGGGPYSKKPDYNRAKSAPPGFGGSLEEAEQLDEVIRKKDGKYCLFSKKTNRNLGCYSSKEEVKKREKQVQYFKRLKENVLKEREPLEEDIIDAAKQVVSDIGSWAGEKLGVTKPEESVKIEPGSGKGKRALIYGHSQAGGIGLGLKAALKSKGYDVNLVIKNGANDSRLIREIGDVGDPKSYDLVFLFVGGNGPYVPNPEKIATIINFFDPSKTSIVLPPLNLDAIDKATGKKNEELGPGPRNRANRDGILQKFGGMVKVHIPYGRGSDFWDGTHMNHGAAGTKEFIQNVFSGKTTSPPTPTLNTISNALTKPSESSEPGIIDRAIKYIKDKLGNIIGPSVDTKVSQLLVKKLSPSKMQIAELIEKKFLEAGFERNLALAAIVNSYYESGLNPNVTGDIAERVSGRCARQVEENEGPKSPCGGGLFGIHSCGGMGGCRATGKGMSIEEIKDPEKSISTMINYIKKRGFDKKNLGKSVEEMTYNFCYSLEVPANREVNCRNRANSTSKFFQTSSLTESKKITIKFGQQLTEGKKKGKEDRCTRIAKSKYDAWPSAYASGAVVKCRQGKIWKNIKEEEELDETKEKIKRAAKKTLSLWLAGSTATTPPPDATKPVKKASTSKDEIKEEWSDSERKKRKANCSNPKGFTMKQFCKNQRTRSKEGEKTNESLEERKLGKPSSETNLGDWFKRKGAPGKGGGWVDCNTCRDGKCKPCGRQEGEKRSKYPRCRPTPSQCKGYKRRGDNLQREE